ncbi:MAG: Purine ribonucleoside efflux pump NepI [Stenotrophomonas maltophilia]|uniref:Purine ribonucleoside efflux pump NepI n=1 Tax=Stenotrophomonas maltophilia TaxID=40324 RepID=A0A7V8FGX5_STEMA|nr:MAG: Purine ribonucleoside efflux pump NepI [Stenotrophomonas maltophilia]
MYRSIYNSSPPVNAPSSQPAPTPATRSGLPVAALLAFAMTGFIAILTETLPAGLLPQIASGLQVSDALAGQFVTLYALGSLLAAIPLTLATQRWPRRRTLLTAVAGFLLFNSLTTLAPSYGIALVSRFMAGVAAGLSWGILAGYARRLVPAQLQGKALAIAMVGTPLALSLGTPAGTWMGAALGWRASFGVMSVLAVMLVVWILKAVPDLPGQPADARAPLYRVLRLRGVLPVLAVIMVWMLGHNVLYTYVAPYLAAHGLQARVDTVLLTFGLTSLAGIWIIGVSVDRWLRPLVLLCLVGFGVASLVLAGAAANAAWVYLGVALWGLAFGGAATLLQTAAADCAGDHVDVVQAMVTTAWNLAIALGGLCGGLLLARFGGNAAPWAMAAFSLIALLLAAWATHGFRPGVRHGPVVTAH